MKTTLINLWASPSCGKSTIAAGLFARLKERGFSAELVTEVAKEYVWEERKISPLDQYRITAEQLVREERLIGKVEYIVTDSPVRLGLFYADYYDAPSPFEGAIDKILFQRTTAGHRKVDVMLPRRERYDEAGRFQTKEQAIEVHQKLEDWLRSRNVLLSRPIEGSLAAVIRLLVDECVLPREAL